jgi:hypothetical protein
MIATVIGTTKLLKDGAATLTPSIPRVPRSPGMIMLGALIGRTCARLSEDG